MSEPELNFNGNEFRFIALWNNKAMKLIEKESIQEKIREAKIKAIENPVIGQVWQISQQQVVI